MVTISPSPKRLLEKKKSWSTKSNWELKKQSQKAKRKLSHKNHRVTFRKRKKKCQFLRSNPLKRKKRFNLERRKPFLYLNHQRARKFHQALTLNPS